MDNNFLSRRKKMLRAQTDREILRILDHPFLPTLYVQFTSDNLSCLLVEYCPGGDLHVLRQKQVGRYFIEPAARCIVNPTLLYSSYSAYETAKISGPCTESSCTQTFCSGPSCRGSCFSPMPLPSTAKTGKSKDPMANAKYLPQLLAEPTDARSNTFFGTHEYLAPEIIKGEGHGAAVDCWTFGISLYELLYGRTPFKGAGNEETLENVVLQSLWFPESLDVSCQVQYLIGRLLMKDPESRLGSDKGAVAIKQHRCFEGMNWALIRFVAPPELPGQVHEV